MVANGRVSQLVLAAAVACAVPTVYAQQDSRPAVGYPNKPIRIVSSEPRGGTDFAARIVQGISAALNQPVIVESRGGGLSPSIVAGAQPDGYTLLVAGSVFWIGPLIRKASYDPVKNFSPITLIGVQPTILVVHPSVAANSVKELIDLAKAKPGALNYASTGIGASAHLAAELLKAMAGVNIAHVPYKGTGAATIGLLGAQVQLLFATPVSVTSLIKAGKLRALAVTSAKPSALVPGVPPVATTMPGYEIRGASAMFAPAGTPAAIVGRLNQEAVRLLNQPEVKEKFFNVGVEVVGNSPAELAAVLKAEMARLGKVIRDAGIRED